MASIYPVNCIRIKKKKTKTIFLLDFNKHETIFGWYTIRHCINDSIRSRQHQHIQMMLKWHHKKHLCVHRHCQLQIEKKTHTHTITTTRRHTFDEQITSTGMLTNLFCHGLLCVNPYQKAMLQHFDLVDTQLLRQVVKYYKFKCE